MEEGAIRRRYCCPGTVTPSGWRSASPARRPRQPLVSAGLGLVIAGLRRQGQSVGPRH